MAACPALLLQILLLCAVSTSTVRSASDLFVFIMIAGLADIMAKLDSS